MENKQPQIILNADDFGKSPTRNKAIDDAFKQHLIHSAGLIVTGQYLQEAVDLAKRGGYIDQLHIHFNLSANLLHENSDDRPLTVELQKDPFFCENGKFKQYRGLNSRFSDVGKWKEVYNELSAQFEKFISVTQGEANLSHVDFHLWYNLMWPVSIALRHFTKVYHIKSVRYIGIHQRNKIRLRLIQLISQIPFVNSIPATNIDYFLSNSASIHRCKVIELYCHPNYKDGVLLDDSPSYLKHGRNALANNIRQLKEAGYCSFISWNDILV